MRLSRKYPVPADLALLYEFINSLDERHFVKDRAELEGSDALGSVEQLEAWMRERGLLGAGVRLDTKCLNKARKLRRALRELLLREPADRNDPAVAAELNAIAAEYPLLVQIAKGTPVLEPRPGVRSGGLAAILGELQRAAHTGALDRLKICASDECRWAFFDRSKPATRRWCNSGLCGNREKTRAYRERQRQR
jgi:predicted RNA-binding Zn ribbon-like protein